MTLALEIENTSYSIGKKCILNDISLSIMPGELTVLLGRNGAGKTTLVSLITRLYFGTQSHIKIYGHDINQRSSAALKEIGVVFQTKTMDSDLTVLQNLQYHLALHGYSSKQAKQRIYAECDYFNISGLIPRKVHTLSGGQTRLVEITRAMLHQPKLLLLDEATTSLDISSRQQIIEHTHRLVQEKNIAVLWTTHLTDEILASDTVVILHHGQILLKNNAEQLQASDPTHSLSQIFLQLTGEPH